MPVVAIYAGDPLLCVAVSDDHEALQTAARAALRDLPAPNAGDELGAARLSTLQKIARGGA